MNRLTERNNKGIAQIESLDVVGDVIQKLAEYEDLAEQGRLLELPCTKGDTVYRIEQMWFKECSEVIECEFTYWLLDAKLGEDYFLTREEAEAKLKEISS